MFLTTGLLDFFKINIVFFAQFSRKLIWSARGCVCKILLLDSPGPACWLCISLNFCFICLGRFINRYDKPENQVVQKPDQQAYNNSTLYHKHKAKFMLGRKRLIKLKKTAKSEVESRKVGKKKSESRKVGKSESRKDGKSERRKNSSYSIPTRSS